MPPPRKVGDRRAANWSLSERTAGKLSSSLEISRWSIWVFGDKAAALALSERAMAANPIEKDALTGATSHRNPRPGGGADRRIRPSHRRFTETTLDTVRGRSRCWPPAHSRAAPARSNVRSASERSALRKNCCLAWIKITAELLLIIAVRPLRIAPTSMRA